MYYAWPQNRVSPQNNTDSEAHSKDLTQVITNLLHLKFRPGKYSLRLPEPSDSTWDVHSLHTQSLQTLLQEKVEDHLRDSF